MLTSWQSRKKRLILFTALIVLNPSPTASNIMPAKKTTPKVAAKKAAAPAPAKKASAKKATKTAAKPAVKSATKKPAAKKAPASYEAIAHAAYLNYRRRMDLGLPGDHDTDWLEAEGSTGA